MDSEARERLARVEQKLDDFRMDFDSKFQIYMTMLNDDSERLTRLSGRVWGLAILALTTALGLLGAVFSKMV